MSSWNLVVVIGKKNISDFRHFLLRFVYTKGMPLSLREDWSVWMIAVISVEAGLYCGIVKMWFRTWTVYCQLVFCLVWVFLRNKCFISFFLIAHQATDTCTNWRCAGLNIYCSREFMCSNHTVNLRSSFTCPCVHLWLPANACKQVNTQDLLKWKA